jgi:hypothetical protein
MNMKLHTTLLVFVLILGSSTLNGTTSESRPMHEIHSMMVYNFLKYVEWPTEMKTGSFKIAIVGSNDVFGTLTSWYSNKKKGAQNFEIQYYKSVEEIPAECHMVYLASHKSREFSKLQEKIVNKSTLVVSDGSGLGKKGSTINFKIVDGKLRFELNRDSFDAHNLKVAAELANLAILI